MKSRYFALVLAALLAVSCDLSAEARPASHSGTASGFKGGFSSQKNNYLRSAPAPTPAPVQTSAPGAFGQAGGADAPPAQPSRSTSALSRDLEQNAAQANALKTLDARRAAAAAPPPPPPQPGAAPVYKQPAYAQPNLPPAQPIIVQQPGSGFMHGVLGFMLGRAISQPQPGYYPQNNGGHASSNTGDWDSGTVSTASTSAAMTPVPQAATAPSFLGSVLRLFLWLALVGGLVWLLMYTLRKLRRLRSANAEHYSFERN